VTFADVFAKVLKRKEPQLEKEQGKKPKSPMTVRDGQERACFVRVANEDWEGKHLLSAGTCGNK